jgi:hypothetical protein
MPPVAIGLDIQFAVLAVKGEIQRVNLAVYFHPFLAFRL